MKSTTIANPRKQFMHAYRKDTINTELTANVESDEEGTLVFELSTE